MVYAQIFLPNLHLRNFQLVVSGLKIHGDSQFDTSAFETGFIPPVSLKKGLSQTLNYEFIEDNTHKETFETE